MRPATMAVAVVPLVATTTGCGAPERRQQDQPRAGGIEGFATIGRSDVDVDLGGPAVSSFDIEVQALLTGVKPLRRSGPTDKES